MLADPPADPTLSLYLVYHDCGKPFCLEFDAAGRRHFPDHAAVSPEVFTRIFQDPIAAELISRDMDIHLLKAEGIEDFCSKPYSNVLLLSGLAETHANSLLFGGMDSTSFKIKWKSINQRGKSILKIMQKREDQG